jgi:hypothetical protein
MEIAVWIVSGLLAFVNLGAGASKLVMPRDKHVAQQPWAGDFTHTQVRLIGVAEVLAAFGLILPRLLDIAPILSPIAAAGIVLLQAGAMSVHLRRKEMIVPNIVILVLAGFVATAGFLGY